MFIFTVDTNVWYQALRNSTGASYAILKLAREQKFQVALSVPVLTEYEDVLLRSTSLQDLRLTSEDVKRFLGFLVVVGTPYKIYFRWRPNLADEKDNIFVELSIASGSRYLITNNVRDFIQKAELQFESFIVITPAQFMKMWRQNEQ